MAYKDIAELMMTTIGAVSAKVYKTKLPERLLRSKPIS
jgi:hypothetical protein